MLGDSVRRRQRGKKASRGSRQGKRPWWGRRLFWLWVGAVVVPPFAGYLIATQVLFPKPPLASLGTTVPQLVGLRLVEAQRELVAVGLGALLPTELPSAEVPAGVITAQSPLAGQQAQGRSGVRVAVSSGRPTVAVPDVRGFALERATTLLRGLGFEVRDSLVESELPAGRVSGAEPDAGTVLQLPDTVLVFISTGPPPDTLAQDTFFVRTDTIARTATRWPAAAAAPIFAGDGVFRRIERDGN